MSDARPPHRVTLVVFEPAQLLDVTGPLEVFAGANSVAKRAGRAMPYATSLATPRPGSVTTTSGMTIVVSHGLSSRGTAPDTLLVTGGPGARAAADDSALTRRIRTLCDRSPRVGSICTGAYVLAATGLLDGRRATTHWAHFDDFAARYPRVNIDRDALFVVDGRFHTSGGISAGIDSALAIVEADCGRAVALQVARELVVFLKRPGGQSQFGAQLAAESAAEDPVRFGKLTSWMSENLSRDLSVAALAERAAMSPRNFARQFACALRMPPARYVQSLRVDAARRLLTDSRLSIARIADRCGFASPEAMRSSFQRALNVSPSDFRERFRSTS
jgi:transcriptional regulator GlxA family with amidase domain